MVDRSTHMTASLTAVWAWGLRTSDAGMKEHATGHRMMRMPVPGCHISRCRQMYRRLIANSNSHCKRPNLLSTIFLRKLRTKDLNSDKVGYE